MTHLVIQPTATAEWQALVKEGEQVCHYHLGDELQSYLVFLLMRFMSRPDIAASVLAFEWSYSQQMGPMAKQDALQTIGDKCLLFAGFYPKQAERKHVNLRYFIQLGQTAYAELSEVHRMSLSSLFAALCGHFVKLMDVLQAIRELSGENLLTPLEAMELWSSVGSQRAFAVLKQHSANTPLKQLENETSTRKIH